MTTKTGEQIITVHTLPNISRSKGNVTIKFSQLTNYNMKIIFFEKPYSKCDGKHSPRTFSKNSKLNISVDQQSKILYSLFLLYAQVEDYRNIL